MVSKQGYAIVSNLDLKKQGQSLVARGCLFSLFEKVFFKADGVCIYLTSPFRTDT